MAPTRQDKTAIDPADRTVPSPMTIANTLWTLLAGRRRTLAWLGILVAAETILVLGGARLLRAGATQTGHHDVLLTGTLLAVVLTAGLSVIGAAASWLGNQVGQQVTSKARRQLMRRLLAMPQDKLEHFETAGILSRLNQDLPWTSQAFLQIYRSLLADAPLALVIVGYLFTLSWRLALAALLSAPLIAWWSGWMARRMARLARAYSDALAGRSAFQQDILSRAALIKSTGALREILTRYNEREDKVLELALALARKSALADPGGVLIAVAALAGVAFLGSRQVSSGQLSQVSYLAFLAGLGLLVVLVRRMSGRLAGTGRAFGALARVISLYQRLPEPRTQHQPFSPKTPNLTFESVTFRYRNNPPIFESLGFRADPGRITLVVGRSGVGKSSLLKLGAGLYAPTQGRVLLEDHDILSLTSEQRAQWISWLGQDGFVLDESIAFNLTMGRDISRHRLVDTLAEVGLKELIHRMDASIDDHIGEDGRRMSAGQRRRLALARCLLSPAMVLLLDEPTESLDDQTALRIADVLSQEARKGRTLLVATHDHRIYDLGDVVVDLDSPHRA